MSNRGLKRRVPEPIDPPDVVLTRNRERILSYPGVREVSIGTRTRQGISLINEICIVVRVEKKSNLIWPQLREIEGVPIDIVEM